MTSRNRWLVVVIFALAMAWVESAVVFYLRTMLNRIDPYQPYPLPLLHGFGEAELVRELATLIMLTAVGWLAGTSVRTRFAYFVIAFGMWDLGYYAFLKVLTGWPHSLLDWDILFLLPLPWWGPVLAPALIATLMILFGTLVTQTGPGRVPAWPRRTVWCLCAVGALLALYVFMADALRVAPQGAKALRHLLPELFDWPLFLLAIGLMALPVLALLRQPSESGTPPAEPDARRWLDHFERNRANRPEPDWTAPVTVRPGALPAVIRSLEQFQLGDGGGPASLIAINADGFRNRTPELRAIVNHWFREEAGHARLLACAVDRLGGQRIDSHWSFTAFCLCRKWLGVRFELQILTLTELVSTAYYRVLQRHVGDTPIVAMCGLILRDEAGHVAFHRNRLVSEGCSPRGFLGELWRTQFWVCGHIAATVLWISHRACLTGIGGSRVEYYQEVRRELRRFVGALAADAQKRIIRSGRGVWQRDGGPDLVNERKPMPTV